MNNGYINRTICVAAANAEWAEFVQKSPRLRSFAPLFPPLPRLFLPPPPRASSARLLFRSVLPLLSLSSPSPSFVARFALVTGEKNANAIYSRLKIARDDGAQRDADAFSFAAWKKIFSVSRVRDVDAPMSNRPRLDFDETIARLCLSEDYAY